MTYQNEAVDQAKERFEVMMSEEVGRDGFLDHLGSKKIRNELIIPSKRAYESLSVLVLIALDAIDQAEDIKNALRLVELSNQFFVENKELGSHPRSYLSKILEAHQMFTDIDFWEKAIF